MTATPWPPETTVIDGAQLSAAFARTFSRNLSAADAAGPQPASLLGLEHEYTVHDAAGARLDFRSLIHTLPIDGARLDPGDPNAYRCAWGGVFTADGAEAEIATPPIGRAADLGTRLADWASRGRLELERVLPPGTEIRGYSTHLSAAMPARLTERAARIYAERFAPALMLLLEGPASPGVLVRPRPGRLEVCGEFADGPRLAAVAAFVAASARLCGLAAHDRRARRLLPPRLRFRIAPATVRYGWFVDRRAFGFDLYAAGRSGAFRRRFVGRIDVQAYLAAAWAAAREHAVDLAAADLELLDRLIDGRSPLAIEASGGLDAAAAGSCTRPAAVGETTALPRPAEGRLLESRPRPGFRVEPVLATWDFALFALSDGSHRAYASVPRPAIADFLGTLDAGSLDGLLAAFLAGPEAGRLLASAEEATKPGLHDGYASARSLLPPERAPAGGGPMGERPGKRQDQATAEAGGATPIAFEPPARSRSLVVGAAAAVSLLLVGAVLVVAGVVPIGRTAPPVAVTPTDPLAPIETAPALLETAAPSASASGADVECPLDVADLPDGYSLSSSQDVADTIDRNRAEGVDTTEEDAIIDEHGWVSGTRCHFTSPGAAIEQVQSEAIEFSAPGGADAWLEMWRGRSPANGCNEIAMPRSIGDDGAAFFCEYELLPFPDNVIVAVSSGNTYHDVLLQAAEGQELDDADAEFAADLVELQIEQAGGS